MSDLEPEHECENCGELRHNLLGGEGIHKCSNVVEKDDLRELIQDMKFYGGPEVNQWVERLEELIDDE